MWKFTANSLVQKIFISLIFLISSQISFAQNYSATEIYGTGFENLTANSLSDNGKVVGVNNGQSIPGAFLWNNGTFTDLGAQYYNKAIAEGWSYATNTAMGVNNNGLVVGYATTQTSEAYHPLIWDNGNVTDIYYEWGDNGKSLAVNNDDQFVYATYNNGGHNAMWIVDWNTFRARGILACPSCSQNIGFPISIADVSSYELGAVVGKVVVPQGEGTATHGFYWNNGTFAAVLGSLGNGQGFSAAFDINGSNQIVGLSGSGEDQPVSGDEAFLWQNGEMTELSPLPGSDSSAAFAINDSGLIVGTSGGRAVIWIDGQIFDLNDLLNLPDITLISAKDINSDSNILADGLRGDGTIVNLLLTPIPELSAFWQFLIAGGLLGLQRIFLSGKHLALQTRPDGKRGKV